MSPLWLLCFITHDTACSYVNADSNGDAIFMHHTRRQHAYIITQSISPSYDDYRSPSKPATGDNSSHHCYLYDFNPPRHPQLIHLAYEKRGSGIVSQKPCCSVTFRSGRGCLWCLCQVRTLFAMADQCLSEYAWLMLRRYFLLPR